MSKVGCFGCELGRKRDERFVLEVPVFFCFISQQVVKIGSFAIATGTTHASGVGQALGDKTVPFISIFLIPQQMTKTTGNNVVF